MDPQDKRPPANGPRPQPTSAPEVPKELLSKKRPAMPKELLSARPAMTRVVPRRPETMNQPAQPAPKPEPTPEEIAERQERLEYLRSLRERERNPKKGTGKKVILTLLALVVLVGLAAGAYWFMNKPAANAPVATTQPQQSQQAQTTAPAKTPPATEMKDYDSTNFAVSLKYPAQWTISDTKDKLTITSTQQNLTAPNGDKMTGQVVVTLRPKQTSLDDFKAGNAVAVLDSKKLTYSQPAAGQRDSTYVSYLQYAKTTVKGTLDAMYITGNAGYKKGQAVPQIDVVKVDPLISVSFTQCPAGATCATNAPAAGIQADAWASSDLNKTVEKILESLAIS